MTDRELKAMEALIGHRLSAGELDQLRAAADRMADRLALNQRFVQMLEAYRAANPAAVSPKMGFA